MESSGLENFLGLEACWMRRCQCGFLGAEVAVQKRWEGSDKY